MSRQQLQLIKNQNRFAGIQPADLTEPEAESLMALALQLQAHRHRKGQALTSPEQSIYFLRFKLAQRHNEVFLCVFLDNKHRIIAVDEMFQGTIDTAKVHPREVVLRSLRTNAAAVIFAHNHPSGDPTPSRGDKEITKKLKEALALLDVRVLDHIVVGTEGAVSMAERGMV